MSVTDAVRARKSTRAFTDEPVPLETIREILSLAARAPSGGNTQPWHVYVLHGKAKERLSSAAMGGIARREMGKKPDFSIYPKEKQSAAYMARRRKVGADMFKLLGIARDDKARRNQEILKNFGFFGAPVGIILTVDAIVDKNGWGHTGSFLQNICLLAEERGLATCLQEAWSMVHSAVEKELNIAGASAGDSGQIVWCGIALGYPDKQAPVNQLVTERVPVDEFARFSGFDQINSSL